MCDLRYGKINCKSIRKKISGKVTHQIMILMGLLITSKIYIISLVTFNKYTIDVYCVGDCASEMDFACMI